MLGLADLIERVNQGVLLVRLERNVKVDGCTSGGMIVVLPLYRNRIPRMLHPRVVPTRYDRCSKGDGSGGEEGQHGEPMHGWQKDAEEREINL
jgi:hypothetical protein